MNFKEKNKYSYLMNQWNEPKRQKLNNLLIKSAGLTKSEAIDNADSACYFISNLEIYMFNDINLVSDIEISKFLFDGKYFVAKEGCYQRKSAKICLENLQDAGLVKTDYALLDIDKDYTGWNRKKVYDKMLERLHDNPDVNLRVCFCSDAKYIDTPDEDKHDHALIVTCDNDGNYVVCDTSVRPHEYPGNMMNKYINADNIRWFTQLY